MNTENGSIRFEIDGRWTAAEMAASIQDINFLYDLRLYLNHLEDLDLYWEELYHFFPPFRKVRKRHDFPFPHLMHGGFLYRPDDVQHFSRLYFPQHALTIARIHYASPGSKDFLGIGEILKQVREFVQFLITLPQQKERQRLDNEGQRIKNARNFVKLRSEYTRANAEIQSIESAGLAALVDDNTKDLVKLIADKKITGTLMLDEQDEDAV